MTKESDTHSKKNIKDQEKKEAKKLMDDLDQIPVQETTKLKKTRSNTPQKQNNPVLLWLISLTALLLSLAPYVSKYLNIPELVNMSQDRITTTNTPSKNTEAFALKTDLVPLKESFERLENHIHQWDDKFASFPHSTHNHIDVNNNAVAQTGSDIDNAQGLALDLEATLSNTIIQEKENLATMVQQQTKLMMLYIALETGQPFHHLLENLNTQALAQELAPLKEYARFGVPTRHNLLSALDNITLSPPTSSQEKSQENGQDTFVDSLKGKVTGLIELKKTTDNPEQIQASSMKKTLKKLVFAQRYSEALMFLNRFPTLDTDRATLQWKAHLKARLNADQVHTTLREILVGQQLAQSVDKNQDKNTSLDSPEVSTIQDNNEM